MGIIKAFFYLFNLYSLLIFCAFCNSKEDSGDFLIEDESSDKFDVVDVRDVESLEGEGFLVTPNEEAARYLAGTWAGLQVVSHFSNFPGYNAVATISIMWQLLEIEHSGNGIMTVTEKMCDLKVETPMMPVDTVVPDAFIQHLETTERHAVSDGILSGSNFESDTMIEVRGCHLQDKIHDELCYSPDDPRTYDQDEDGHPGVTLHFTGAINASVYVTQRWTSKYYNAVVNDGDHISGHVISTSEQQIVDSTNTVIDGPDPDPPELGSWPDPDPEHSYFELVRLPPQSTCEDVIALGLTPR